MCGIAGILNFGLHSSEKLYQICSQMTDVLGHRGPNDRGVWMSQDSLVALGHRRLSILDLSPEGHQPMVSACSRYAIVYNGEVYNYLAIREELKREGSAPVFRGHSDTEVILAAISAWGLKKTVLQLNGIFAFGLWDKKEKQLSLVRDRIGVKPLYYGWAGKSLVFGSELKSFTKHPAFDRTIDRNVLTLYFRHNYIPAPYSIYEKAFKLEPGHILTISPFQPNSDKRLPLKSAAYWSAKDVWLNGASNQWQGNEDEAVDTLDNLLKQAVKSQMISDVPLGAFLSGGIDSSTVTALMQVQSSIPVKTFSIGFHESGYNEAVFAKTIASYLGTDHTELYVTDRQAQDVIPLLPCMYDEPFADSSQIPTYLVSKLARQHVTVSLSGDGGDELFGGYNRYRMAEKLWADLERLPNIFKKLASIMIGQLPVKALDFLGYPLNPMLKMLGYRPGRIGDRLKKYSGILSLQSRQNVYLSVVSYVDMSYNPAIFSKEPDTILTGKWVASDTLDYYQRMMLLDMLTYLPDDILVKVDRASMHVALEVRVPILDHRVIEFASTLPTNTKIRNSSGKWILKKLLNKYIPLELTERPKMGFGVPVGEWLRGPLRNWAENLLGTKAIESEGLLDGKLIQGIWNQHSAGLRDWSSQLWGVLMFQSWLHDQGW